MFIFELQLFGGGKGGSSVTYTQAQVPEASAEEKALMNEQLKWAQQTQPVASQLLDMGVGALNNQQVTANPNWQTLYDNAQAQTWQNNNLVQSLIPQTNNAVNAAADSNAKYSGLLGSSVTQMSEGNKALGSQYDTAMANNQTATNGLLSGQMPAEYAQARQQALQSDLTNTVGSTLSGLASRGIINSSQADGAFNDISKNASNSLANSYASDMAQVANMTNQNYANQLSGINGKAGLIGSTFANQLNGYGQQANLGQNDYTNAQQNISTLSQLANQSQQMATDPISTAATSQEAAINVPMQYLAMATGQNAPTQSLLSSLGNQRYSVAAPAQAVVKQGSGGLFGGLTSGLAGVFCFVAGTPIVCTTGAVNIEDVKTDDEVISLGTVEKVIKLHDMGTKPIFRVETITKQVYTTQIEKFLTVDGLKPLDELARGDEIMTVNGFESITVIEDTGREEQVYELECTGQNLFYAGGILAEGLTESDKELNQELDQQEGPPKKKRTYKKRISKESEVK